MSLLGSGALGEHVSILSRKKEATYAMAGADPESRSKFEVAKQTKGKYPTGANSNPRGTRRLERGTFPCTSLKQTHRP